MQSTKVKGKSSSRPVRTVLFDERFGGWVLIIKRPLPNGERGSMVTYHRLHMDGPECHGKGFKVDNEDDALRIARKIK